MVLVDATEDGLRLRALVGVAKVEGEHGLVQQTLVERVVERRNNLVHADGVVTKTENTIEPAEGKRETGLGSGFCEVLVLDLQVTNLESVLGHETAERSRSVADLEVGAVLLVGRRSRRIVLGVEVASDRAALGRRDPKVGASGVKDDLEVLRRRSDGDLGEVYMLLDLLSQSRRALMNRLTLCVQEVGDGHRMGSVGDVGCLEDLLDVRLALEAHVLLSEGLGLVVEGGGLLRQLAPRLGGAVQALRPELWTAQAEGSWS